MDYDSNSNEKRKKAKAAAERPKVEKVVTGEVTERKKSLGTKFKGIFFGGDFKSAAHYVAADVLLPAARNMLADATKGAVDRVIYGDTRRPDRYDGRPNYAGRVQYNNPINRAARPDPRDPRRSQSMPRRNDPAEFVVPDRDEAEQVLDRLIDLVDQYETASLADLYDLLGMRTQNTDYKWGWTNLNSAQIVQLREGYLLQLPELEPLD